MTTRSFSPCLSCRYSAWLHTVCSCAVCQLSCDSSVICQSSPIMSAHMRCHQACDLKCSFRNCHNSTPMHPLINANSLIHSKEKLPLFVCTYGSQQLCYDPNSYFSNWVQTAQPHGKHDVTFLSALYDEIASRHLSFVISITYLNVVLGLYNSKSAPLDATRFQNLYNNVVNEL